MNIQEFFDAASRAMTVLSFITFIGIVWWAYIHHGRDAFEGAALLPFADDDAAADIVPSRQEQRHV
jgi:cytochrome c oxidase cbb3-type subunit 4